VFSTAQLYVSGFSEQNADIHQCVLLLIYLSTKLAMLQLRYQVDTINSLFSFSMSSPLY